MMHKRFLGAVVLVVCAGCGRTHYDVLRLPDAGGQASDAGPLDPGRDAASPDGGVDPPPDASGRRCEALTCTGIPGHDCLGDLCVAGAWADIAFADTHLCMIPVAPGPVYCLGANERGQLGDGTRTASRTFVRVAGLEAARVFAGRSHSCALDGSALWCWGANDAGQSGASPGADVLEPTRIEVAPDSVVLGVDHTCFVEGRSAFCFGGNAHGQLADGTTASRSSTGAAIATDAIAIGAGDGTTCVLSDAGAISCAGRNDRGQLAVDGGGRTTLTRIGTAETFVALGLGDAHAAAISSSGALRTWGANDVGQLGVGSTEPVEGLASPAVESSASLAVGSRHVFVITSTSRTFAWGDNSELQIRFGGMTEPMVTSPSSVPLAGFPSVRTGGSMTYATDVLGRYYFGAFEDELLNPYGDAGGTMGGEE